MSYSISEIHNVQVRVCFQGTIGKYVTYINHHLRRTHTNAVTYIPSQNPNEAKWARLVKTTYRDPHGIERTWESGERQTRPATSSIDGVGIVTILNKSSGPELLLQKQYRPPIDKVVIEVPAGLIDPGESVEVCAVRELKEETGLVGVAEQTSGVMYNGVFFSLHLFPWLGILNSDGGELTS